MSGKKRDEKTSRSPLICAGVFEDKCRPLKAVLTLLRRHMTADNRAAPSEFTDDFLQLFFIGGTNIGQSVDVVSLSIDRLYASRRDVVRWIVQRVDNLGDYVDYRSSVPSVCVDTSNSTPLSDSAYLIATQAFVYLVRCFFPHAADDIEQQLQSSRGTVEQVLWYFGTKLSELCFLSVVPESRVSVGCSSSTGASAIAAAIPESGLYLEHVMYRMAAVFTQPYLFRERLREVAAWYDSYSRQPHAQALDDMLRYVLRVANCWPRLLRVNYVENVFGLAADVEANVALHQTSSYAFVYSRIIDMLSHASGRALLVS